MTRRGMHKGFSSSPWKSPAAPSMNTDESLIESFRQANHRLVGQAAEEPKAEDQVWSTLRERAAALNDAKDQVEFQFSITSAWSQLLFFALLKQYGIKPYRYRGQ